MGSDWISLLIFVVILFLPLALYVHLHYWDFRYWLFRTGPKEVKPSLHEAENEVKNLNESSTNFGEQSDLRSKLHEIEKKLAELQNYQAQENLAPEKRLILDESIQFLHNQKNIVNARLLVLESIYWENRAYNEYRSVSALDFTTPANDVVAARNIIKSVVEKGRQLKAKWMNLEQSFVGDTARELLPRLDQILTICQNFLEELENEEIARLLKGVKEFESVSTKMLPDTTVSDSMEILEQFRARPLNQNLLFEQLRVNSLTEISKIEID